MSIWELRFLKADGWALPEKVFGVSAEMLEQFACPFCGGDVEVLEVLVEK